MTFVDTVLAADATPPSTITAAEWLGHVLERQKDRLILWAPVFFGCGIGVYFVLRFEPPVFATATAFAMSVTVAGFAWKARQWSEGFYPVWLAALAVMLMVSGLADAQMRTLTRHTIMLAKPVGPVDVEGRIIALDDLAPGQGTQLTLDQLSIEHVARAVTPQRVRIKVRDADGLLPGARISVLSRLTPPAPPDMPGAFDFQRYAWFKGLGAYGFSYGTPKIISTTPPGAMAQGLARLRQAMAARIDAAIPYPQSSIVKTLAVGARASIDAKDEDAMRAAGLAHMLVVAGLHISLVTGLIFFTVRFGLALVPRLALYRPIKKYAAVAAFMAALAYTLLSGASVPTLRAMIMTGVVLTAVVTDRVVFSPRLVALAALAVLGIAPEALMGPSFQMSFAAVTALIMVYDAMRPVWTRLSGEGGWARRTLLYLFGICVTTVVATLATAPFAIYQFQNFSPYGVIGNVLAIPVLSVLVMPMTIVGCLLMPIGLEHWPLRLSGYAVGVILRIAHGVAALPHSTMLIPAPSSLALAALTVAGTIVLFWRGRGAVAASIPLAFAVFLMARVQPPDVLYSADAKLIAVRAGGQYLLSSRMADRFAGKDWLSRLGQEPAQTEKLPTEGVTAGGIICGEGGCRWQDGERKIALSLEAWTQREDCSWADILVALQPVRVRDCHAGVVADRFTVWRDGAVVLWRDGRMETVAEDRGQRPWVPVMAPRRKYRDEDTSE